MDVQALQEESRIDAMDGYADPGQRPPLLSYAVTIAIFNAIFGGGLLAARAQRPGAAGAGRRRPTWS